LSIEKPSAARRGNFTMLIRKRERETERKRERERDRDQQSRECSSTSIATFE